MRREGALSQGLVNGRVRVLRHFGSREVRHKVPETNDGGGVLYAISSYRCENRSRKGRGGECRSYAALNDSTLMHRPMHLPHRGWRGDLPCGFGLGAPGCVNAPGGRPVRPAHGAAASATHQCRGSAASEAQPWLGSPTLVEAAFPERECMWQSGAL